ncbi:MAG: family 20 glycosylhydrolase, partial [Myxococcota bacterium]|nr:family 20 glycosylhydrolase [Myxococcota bacterium]
MRSRAEAHKTALRVSADSPLINKNLRFLLMSFLFATGCTAPFFPALMPHPKEVVQLQNRVDLDETINVSIPNGFEENLVPVLESTLHTINKIAKKQITFKYDTQQRALINISCDKPVSDILDLAADESYELDIQQGAIAITAPECIGALRGLQTLIQLYIKNRSYGYFPGVTITDTPRFPWRGLLLDIARHWQPLDNIKRNIDAMAYLKMNVLHLHLSDDQGFRVESKRHPLLHEKGSSQKYYRQEEIKEIIEYAKQRGVYIVPEFDVPAHTTSWFVGYPQYASQPGPYSISKKWGVHTPVFNPTIEATYS